MTEQFSPKAFFWLASAVVSLGAFPAVAAEQTLQGSFAMPDQIQTVQGKMIVRETGPLTRQLELTYTNAKTGKQVPAFDVELTQQLHILAVDDALDELVHRHVEEAGPDGVFSAELPFPDLGTYHIYTDAAPTGLGQQVLRFDLAIGEPTAGQPSSKPPLDITEGPISSSDGGYTVVLDASQLRSGKEGAIGLTIQKDGQPAMDLAPYLGVAAHVVLIRAEDLAYVHSHASADASMLTNHNELGGTSTEHSIDHGHDMPAPAHSEHGEDHDAASNTTTQDHSMHDDALQPTASGVPPELTVYVTPPAAGIYGLWIEFIGGGEVRTVPFKIEIPAA
jgi:hypothetical protein